MSLEAINTSSGNMMGPDRRMSLSVMGTSRINAARQAIARLEAGRGRLGSRFGTPPACVEIGKTLGSRGRSSNAAGRRSEEHTSELQSQSNLVCRLLLEKKNDPSTHPRALL